MRGPYFAGFAAAALSFLFSGTPAVCQTEAPKSPRWYLAGTAPDPTGHLPVGPGGKVLPAPAGQSIGGGGFSRRVQGRLGKILQRPARFQRSDLS